MGSILCETHTPGQSGVIIRNVWSVDFETEDTMESNSPNLISCEHFCEGNSCYKDLYFGMISKDIA
jgi:hypothetical protein